MSQDHPPGWDMAAMQRAFDDARTGAVPWTLEGYQEFLAHISVDHQEFEFLYARYGPTLAPVHGMRAAVIADFMHRHRGRLLHEGLIYASSPTSTSVRDDLLTVLVALPYGRRMRFVLQEVMRALRAQQRKANEPGAR
jgi:hypothetical protein